MLGLDFGDFGHLFLHVEYLTPSIHAASGTSVMNTTRFGAMGTYDELNRICQAFLSGHFKSGIAFFASGFRLLSLGDRVFGHDEALMKKEE